MKQSNISLIIVIVFGYYVFSSFCIKIGGPFIKVPVIVTLPTLPTTTGPTVTTTTPAPVTTNPKITPTSTIETGIGCGTKRMKPFEVVQIQSNNFNLTDYPNNDACTWTFIGKECTISAECPCFDVPPSFDCIEDYLKILDLPFYHQKFCGGTVPNGAYRASTEVFSVRFRSNKRQTGKGFVCYVQCTPPGYADQRTPNATTICPNFRNYY